MRLFRTFALASLVAIPGIAAAQSAEDAVEARHGYMTMLSINMGVLAGMARGEIEYDENTASTAAANIEALTHYDGNGLFVAGSANGEFDGSNALPAIWQQPEQFAQGFVALGEAAAGASDAVRGGQANVGPALQKLGVACKDCHDDFRKPQ